MQLRNIANRESGFGVFAYILMTIALLATLTGALSVITRNNNRGQNNDILVSKIYSQASKIRADINLCMTETQTLSTGLGPTGFQRYPICNAGLGTACVPQTAYGSANYCSNCSTTNPVYADARTLRCVTPAQISVWDNSEGNFFPDRIQGFEEWKYAIEGATSPTPGGISPRGVSIMISSSSYTSDEDTDWVLRKVVSRFGANEAMVLRRTAAGMDPNSFSATACNSPCLANTVRIWLAR